MKKINQYSDDFEHDPPDVEVGFDDDGYVTDCSPEQDSLVSAPDNESAGQSRPEDEPELYRGAHLPDVGPSSIAFNPHLLRSALFGSRPIILETEKKVAAPEQPIILACGYNGSLKFTGPRWGQDHATIIFHLLMAMRGMAIGDSFTLHPRDFAYRALGWSHSVHSQKKLLRGLQDLSEGAIEHSWLGANVRMLCKPKQEGNKVRVCFDSSYQHTLHDKATFISLVKRRELKVGIESWLYQFVRASSCDREMSLSRLRALFASEKSLAEFGRDIRSALKRLEDLKLIGGYSAERGRVRIEKKVSAQPATAADKLAPENAVATGPVTAEPSEAAPPKGNDTTS